MMNTIAKGLYISKYVFLRKIYAILLVLTMQTVYVKVSGSHLDLVFNCLLVGVGILYIILNNKYHYDFHLISYAIIYGCSFVLLPIFHILLLKQINYSAETVITFQYISVFIISVFIICADGIVILLSDIADAIFVTTIISLIFYFLGQNFHILKPIGNININWGGMQSIPNYFYLCFAAQGNSYHSFRNGRFTGIYTEAPMCAFMISFALIVYLLIKDCRYRLFRVIVLCIGVYCAASTTGWIISILTIVAYLFFWQPDSKYMLYLKFLPIIIISLSAGIFVWGLYISKLNADVASIDIRNNNFSSAIIDFKSSPFIGHGFKSDAIGITGGNTSVYSSVLQQGGIFFILWYMLPVIISIILLIKFRKWKICAAIALYLLMLYSTVVTYTSLSVALIACFFAYSVTPQKYLSTSKVYE